MRPPLFAEALVAAVAPSGEFEMVAGDLHEEYLRIRYLSGSSTADRWYWAQVLLSMPSLLSYSRSNRSAVRQIGVGLIAIAVLLAMLVAVTVIQTVLQIFFGFQSIPEYVWVSIYSAHAFVFGATLSWLVRTDGVRVTFFASLFLVLCFVIPAIAGHPGSQGSLVAWIVLFAAVPLMCVGAATCQVIRRKADSSN